MDASDNITNPSESQTDKGSDKGSDLRYVPVSDFGVTSKTHLEDALGTLDISLTGEEVDELDRLYEMLGEFDAKADPRGPR